MIGFEEHVLYSLNIHSVPYIWFYLCSISTVNFLSYLIYILDEYTKNVKFFVE